MPILGDHYGRVVEAGELQLQRDGGSFTVHYHEHVMPIAPRSLDDLLARAAGSVNDDDLAFIADCVRQPPALDRDRPGERDPAGTATRRCSGGPWRRLCWDRPELARRSTA